jgi:hypothetical protein
MVNRHQDGTVNGYAAPFGAARLVIVENGQSGVR